MSHRSALSLVEVAAGLVIIGLLMAMIIAGSQVMGAAEIRGFMTDVQGFQSGISNFRDTYGMLPGDYDGASTRWGVYNASTNPDGTTNGNGREGIAYSTAASGDAVEGLRAWQHLLLADQIKGGFSGVATVASGAGNQADIGVNVPASKRSGVGYYITCDDLASGAACNDSVSPLATRNEIRIGAFRASSANKNGALTAKEAKNLDLKMDDGNAASGNVLGTSGADTANCQTGGTYAISSAGKLCILSFSVTP